MGELLNKPYEISVWEDKLTQDGSGFEEQKIAIIGSNTMSGPNKVYDPVFNKKANGEKTLTFSLKYKYFDPYSENDEVINPFAVLLVNERKVKLYYDDEWYEFIVKDHTEASKEYTWTYTCTDAFVLELSKIGYNLEFSSDLNNNQGTAEELTQKTIEDTDWKLGGTSVGKQLIEEPIYQATLRSVTDIEIENADGDGKSIPGAGAQVYVFYSYVKNQNGKFVQFISGDEESYTIDDRNVITATNFRITTDLTFEDNAFKNANGVTILQIGKAETRYKANRLAYNQLTTYDPVLQRTVDRFKVGDREVYRYTDYTYTTSNVVMNYIANGENFNALEDGTLQGWNPYVGKADGTEPSHEITKLKLVTKPELAEGVELADINLLSQIEGFLVAHFDGALSSPDYENAVYNEGFKYNTSFINAITQGEQFLFRWRAGKGTLDNMEPVQNLGLIVAKYTQDAPTWGYYYKHIDPENIILRIEGSVKELNNIIEGGSIQETEESGIAYVIDGVVQTPSTKYIYISDGEEYIWDGEQGNFIPRTNANYLPYYYVIGEAKRALTNAVLTDSAEKIGIFIYPTGDSAEGDYFIQDIQLTRYVQDANGQPVLIGNVPTATSNPTEYYYLKPSVDSDADDVETFTSAAELLKDIGAEEQLIPLYNTGSEKVLSISASQSNCFNILQTIAETFECWIDLIVDHDARGYINRDEDGRPRKYVYLNEYAGDDNWAGFKYGVNLDTIERNINSDEIVTKLIVNQSQSDYVPEGYVSIANAKSNSSGESYILNFDYYYSQGLLDRDSVEADKAKFIAAVKDINLKYQEKEAQRRDLEASFTELASKRNVYTELVETAKDTKNQARADFEQLTGWSYDDYREEQQKETTIKYEDNYYIPTTDIEIVLDKAYYIYNSETEEMTIVESPDVAAISTYYEILDDLTKEETIFDVLGELYVSSATINNYSGLLSNVEKEYWEVRTKLRGSENYKVSVWVNRDELDQRHVMVELSDFLPGFSFTVGGQSGTSTVSTSFFDVITDAIEITFTAPEGYTIDTTTYEINDSKVAKFKIINNETIEGLDDEIEDLLDEKAELTKEFNNRYSRFIQEGTWNSTDYIDSELYYLDALQVSGTSAFPAISYTINVVEISQLEGYEWYQFDAGDKSYIEDTEFFGWANKNGVLTPAREEVIVSEVEWHLDDPSQNVITVQNYKTRFEDFFQRVNAAVQTVQYNEATYAKISSLMNADGTINQNVLLQSLNRIAGQQYNLTSDGSVKINGDQILVQNLNNSANRVIINSEGIRISSDGGTTWATAIDGRGINIGTVYTGMLNTDQVVIGGTDNPSFRWDKSGISAYKSGQDGIYDLQTYVRYDEYGLYGVKEGGSFKANSLKDIKDKAHFAVTWDGFFIRNNYTGGGRVEITSDNDFRVLNTVGDKENEKIKIGALEWIVPADATFSSEKTYYIKNENGYEKVENPTASQISSYYEKKYEPQPGVEPSLYGIRIKNNAGKDVMTTDDDGNLILTGAIEALEGNFGKLITVGKNDDTVPNWIEIDGTRSSIQTSDFYEGAGSGWMINADGDAVFNNITARGAIKTAVFEYAEIQAVGGVFLFRPSSTIRKARINGADLILTVEKPQLFIHVKYSKVEDPSSEANPSTEGWYERTNYGYSLSTDTSVQSDTEYYVRTTPTDQGSWCKISNYISNGTAPDATIQNILVNNGLTHVYQVIGVNFDTNEVTLSGAAQFINAVKQTGQTDGDVLAGLEGGALVDMGRTDGSANYGIGVNSSDNTVNLPARAISLFETKINDTPAANQVKVTYEYRGILGTLPVLPYNGNNALVNPLYHDYLEDTQGIYTDNMYIGDSNQYITFYTAVDKNKVKTKHLKVNARELTLKAGSFKQYEEDSNQNFIYLSNEDYATDITDGIPINNSDDKTDWRLIIGNKFGVDKAGNLYASNAVISGHIQATSGSFGGGASIINGQFVVEQNSVSGLTSALDEATGYVLTVETDYSNQQNVNLTAHLYYGNKEVTTTKPSSMFRWYRKSEILDYFIVENPTGNPQEKGWYEQEEITEDEETKISYVLTTDTEVVDGKDYYEYTNIEPLGGAYSIRFDRNKAGYSTTIICRFNDEALLTTPDNYAVETPDNYLLTARV